MISAQLDMFKQWIDRDLVDTIDRRRWRRKEIQRKRKLGTLEMIYLMLAVALDNHRNSLFEIISLATADLKLPFSVSVSAFCQARARFSPRYATHPARAVGRQASTPVAATTIALPRLPPAGHRQGVSGLARIPQAVQEVQVPQG